MTAPAQSILAWYNGQQVKLGVGPNALIFDGVQFVPPADVKFVAIVQTVTVGPETVPVPWPETQTIEQTALTWINMWICQVISTGGPAISDRDVVSITDPANGVCICGVTCQGTDIQYVTVSAV